MASMSINHDLRHRLGVPTNQVDVLISQRVGLIAEQLAAPRNRDRLPPVIRVFNN